MAVEQRRFLSSLIFPICVAVFLGTAAAILGLVCVVYDNFRPDVLEYLSRYYGVIGGNGQPVPLSNKEAALLTKLIERGAVLSQGDLLENLTTFYSDIISYLLGIIAVLAVLTVMYVSGVSKSHAEKIVEKEVGSVLASRAFMAALAVEVHKHNKEILDPLLADYEQKLHDNVDEIQRFSEFKNDIERQIATLSEAIAELDDAEAVGPGDQPTI